VTPRNEWDRWYWLWDVYFAITFAATMVLTTASTVSAERKVTSAVALCGIVVTYLAFRRRLIGHGRRSSPEVTFAVVVGILFLVAMLTRTAASFILFAVCPLMYLSLPRKVASVITTLGIVLVPVAVIINFGFDAPDLGTLLPMTALLVVFGLLVGQWTSRVIDQSRGRAELIEKLEASQAEVVRLSRDAGTSAERVRLAREIHDTLAQGFTSIVALTQAIESELDTDVVAARRHLDLAARTARENLAEARAMVAASSPSALAAGSLEDAVRRQAERLREESAIAVSCEVAGPLPVLGTATEVVLLRATQEALTNVRKHARASAVRVQLSVVDSSVRLSVADDGVGFDPDLPANGFGLRGMQARAQQVGGTIKIHSGRSEGTTVELEVPA
jgi:signal transduction histidine kinase